MSSILSRLKEQGHPLAAKWGTFKPFAFVENIVAENKLGGGVTWLAERVSDTGLGISCRIRTSKEQSRGGEAIDHLKIFKKDPDVLWVSESIAVKPRKYLGSDDFIIYSEEGIPVDSIYPEKWILDAHFGSKIYEDLVKHPQRTHEKHLRRLLESISKVVRDTKYADAPIFSTSVLAKEITARLKLASWKLPQPQNALTNMFVSYGKEAKRDSGITAEDIRTMWITHNAKKLTYK